MKVSIKERVLQVRDFVVARGKLVFPILLIAAVAITVTIALKTGSGTVNATGTPDAEIASLSEGNAVVELTVPDVPLELNAYPELNSLVMKYFEAMAAGDADVLQRYRADLTIWSGFGLKNWANILRAIRLWRCTLSRDRRKIPTL